MTGTELPTLAQWQTFLAVLDEGAFDAAARRLHVSPAAVSQRIRALESAVGTVLLQRITPPLPTRAGEHLLPYARRIVTLAHAAVSEALGGAPGTDGVGDTAGQGQDVAALLPLAVNADSLSTWFLDALAAFPEASRTRFHVERVDQELAEQALGQGAVLGAVTTAEHPAPGCTSRRLGVMRYLPVAAPSLIRAHALQPGRPGIAARLERAPVVDYDADDALQRDFLADWTGHRGRPSVHRFPDSPAFVRAIEAGLGWGLVSEAQGHQALAAGRLVRLSASRHHDVVLYWQQWDLGTAALSAFGDHLIRFARARLRR